MKKLTTTFFLIFTLFLNFYLQARLEKKINFKNNKSIESFIKTSHGSIKKSKTFKLSLTFFLELRKKINKAGTRDVSKETLGKVLKIQATFENMNEKFFVDSKSKCLENIQKEKTRLTQGVKTTFKDKDVNKALSIAQSVCKKSRKK